MNDILSRYNKIMKDKTLPEVNRAQLFQRGDLTQIIFSSSGCKKGTCGSCIMCNYGVGKQLTAEEAIGEYRKIISEVEIGKALLLGTYGSFLDTREIIPETFEALLNEVSHSSADTIIIETGYDTVNEFNLKRISTILQHKNIEIELGLESINNIVQQCCLNKVIDLKQYKSVVGLVHSFGMQVSSNIVVGIPFLSPREQINDAIETINWAIEQGSDGVVLFPMNVKQDTLLHHLYQKGRYELISNWLFVETLNKLNNNSLEKIKLSWYEQSTTNNGVRSSKQTNYPKSCELCSKQLIDFYNSFTNSKSGKEKRILINQLIECNSGVCECREKMMDSVREDPKTSLSERVKFEHELLIKEFQKEIEKNDKELIVF